MAAAGSVTIPGRPGSGCRCGSGRLATCPVRGVVRDYCWTCWVDGQTRGAAKSEGWGVDRDHKTRWESHINQLACLRGETEVGGDESRESAWSVMRLQERVISFVYCFLVPLLVHSEHQSRCDAQR